MSLFRNLPRDLQLVVADFCGDPLIRKHRLHSFLRFEFDCIAYICGRKLRPAIIPRIDGFKDSLELAYLHAQRKPSVKGT